MAEEIARSGQNDRPPTPMPEAQRVLDGVFARLTEAYLPIFRARQGLDLIAIRTFVEGGEVRVLDVTDAIRQPSPREVT